MKIDVVTSEQLDAAIKQMAGVIDAGFARLLQPGGPLQHYFTREEAAEYLRMSVRNMDTLTAAGEIRRANVGQGEKKASPLFRRCDLDAFVESRLEMDGKEAEELAARKPL